MGSNSTPKKRGIAWHLSKTAKKRLGSDKQRKMEIAKPKKAK